MFVFPRLFGNNGRLALKEDLAAALVARHESERDDVLNEREEAMAALANAHRRAHSEALTANAVAEEAMLRSHEQEVGQTFVFVRNLVL